MKEDENMRIAGFQKTSFVDFPGKIAAVVFTPYCTMNCTYCHNRHILGKNAPLLDEGEILEYLQKRKGMLDAVVISGGEPTLQPNLQEFIERLRDMGYMIKLDTNGSNPTVLHRLIAGGLLDYVAMDIKAPFEKYRSVTQTDDDIESIRRSVTLLMNSPVEYEFRTTFAPQLTPEDIEVLAGQIKGAKKYCIQQYRKVEADDPSPHQPSVVRRAGELAQNILGIDVEVRGL